MSGRHADAVWTAREKVFGQVRQLELLGDGGEPGAAVQASAPAAGAADDTRTDQPSQAEMINDLPPPVATLPPRRPTPGAPKPKRGWVNRWR